VKSKKIIDNEALLEKKALTAAKKADHAKVGDETQCKTGIPINDVKGYLILLVCLFTFLLCRFPFMLLFILSDRYWMLALALL
jgi:hypothetical protein